MRESLSTDLNIGVDDLPERLASMNSGEILALQQAVGHGGVGIDGTVITRSTYDATADRGKKGVPYIPGSNLDEGTLFSAMIQDPAAFEPGAFELARGVMDGQDPTDYIQVLKDIDGDDPKNLYEQSWVDLFRRPSTKMCAIATSSGCGGSLYRFDLPLTAMGGIFRENRHPQWGWFAGLASLRH